ncbi:hypothetical protein BLOT_003830, partial [Blomia tropicalis]
MQHCIVDNFQKDCTSRSLTVREYRIAKLFDISKIVINFASIESSDQLSTNRQIQTDEYNRSMLQFLEIYIKKNRLFCPLRRKSIRVDERRKKFQYGLKLDVVGRRRFWVTFQRITNNFSSHLSSHLQFLEQKWEDILKIIHHKELNLHLTEQEHNLLLGKPANFKVENLFLKIKGKMVNVFKAAIRHKTSGVRTKEINKQPRIRLVYCSHVKISISVCAI